MGCAGSIFSRRGRNNNGNSRKSKSKDGTTSQMQSTSDIPTNTNNINNTNNKPTTESETNGLTNGYEINQQQFQRPPDLPPGEEKKLNKEIEHKLMIDEQRENKTIGLLLLGAGGSGKSTVLKQMEKIYKGQIAQNALDDAVHYIRQNILEDIFDLSKTNLVLRQRIDDCKLESETSEEVVQKFAELRKNQIEQIPLTPELAKDISILWNDKGMKNTFDIRRRGHIMDNTPYFFDRIHEIAKPSYRTTFDDYIRVRHRTTGIIEANFPVPFQNQEWLFRVTDVGGQRAERKKWIHCFADVHAVIYVMSLSGYDQVLFEDHSTNCLEESLELFRRTASQQVLSETDFIVFLNKNDVFEKKIKNVPFTTFYEQFPQQHAHDSNRVKEFMKNEYRERFYGNIEPKESPRKIHFHVTCATDTNQIQTVMHLIQFETVRKMMQQTMMF